MLDACRLREGSSPAGTDCDRLLSRLAWTWTGNVQNMAQSFVINNSDGINFRQSIIGGVGKWYAIQSQFLIPVRVMPDINVLADGPSTVLTVLNQIKHLVILYGQIF